MATKIKEAIKNPESLHLSHFATPDFAYPYTISHSSHNIPVCPSLQISLPYANKSK